MTETAPTTQNGVKTEIAPKKDWRESRKRRYLSTSATQFETFRLCRRKWWLERVRRLADPTQQAQVFGTVLHAVCERYLRADSLGRDANGRPVELYPPKWEIAYDKFKPGRIEGTATPEEQDKIRKLVTAAIESGILQRREGRVIEGKFQRTIVELGCPDCGGDGKTDEDTACETCKGDGKGTNIQIMGFIDLFYPDEVQDHKSVKDMKWAKSQNALRKNPQMLIYAKQVIEHTREQGGAIPKEIILRHNAFCKNDDDLRVRKTEIAVSIEEIEQEWARVVADAHEMDRLRRKTEVGHQIPDPASPQQACNAYGGCCYRSICSGRESEEGYELRLARVGKDKYDDEPVGTVLTVDGSPISPSVPVTETKGSTMSVSAFAAKLAAKKGINAAVAGAAGAAPPASALNPPASTPAAASTPAPAPEKKPLAEQAAAGAAARSEGPTMPEGSSPPPWAQPGCGACKGKGFNSKGNPCRICDTKAKVAGGLVSDDFVIVGDGNGWFIWEPRDGVVASPGASPTQTNGQAVKVEEKTAPAVERAAAPKPEVKPEEKGGNEEKAGRGGRPKKGWILVINSSVTKGEERKGSGRGVIRLSDVLKEYGDKMAAEAKVDSFYDINAFDRRDALAKVAELIQDDFGTDFVVANGIGAGQSDLKALVDALMPYAGAIINADAM